MASVATNQEDAAMPETPTAVASPGNCGDTLDSDEDISKEDDDHMAGIEYVAAPPNDIPLCSI